MNSLKNEIRVTNHFIERYYERIFKTSIPDMKNIRNGLKRVIEDIDTKISRRDKFNLLFMKNCNRVLVPFETAQIVVKKGVFITILN